MKQSSQIQSCRKEYLDRIRILAMGAVIMIHLTSPVLAGHEVSGISFWITIFLNSVSRFAVPCFLMITGALYLREEKEYTIRQMVLKALKTIFVLYFWSLFYVAVSICSGKNLRLTEALKSLLTGHYHLWYLFILAGLYLSVPILKKITGKHDTRIVLWFLVLALVFQFTKPLLQFAGRYMDDMPIKYIRKFHMEFFSCYVTYLLLGWYLTNTDLQIPQRRAVYAAGVLGLLLSVGGMGLFHNTIDHADEIFCATESVHILLYSAAIFLFLKNRYGKESRPKAWVSLLAPISFGVYLIHPFFLDLIYTKLPFSSIPLQIFVHWTLVFLLSSVASYGISKIPGLRKLIVL